MSDIFYECSSLKKLVISNYKSNKLTDIDKMSHKCSLYKELNTYFNNDNEENKKSILDESPKEFNEELKAKNKNKKINLIFISILFLIFIFLLNYYFNVL